jgi:hypothetical protein
MLLVGCAKETPEPTTTESPIQVATSTTAPTASATATEVPTPTPTPVIPNDVVTLPDGSRIILRPGASIEVLKQPGIPSQSQEILIQLLKGEIMAVSALEGNHWLTIQNPAGVSARFQGCAAVISLDESLGSLELKCLANKCEIGPDAKNYSPAAILFSSIIQKGKLLDPTKFDIVKLAADYEEDYPECARQVVPTTTPTATKAPPTATPNNAATATAACAAFHQQFPATPCPK